MKYLKNGHTWSSNFTWSLQKSNGITNISGNSDAIHQDRATCKGDHISVVIIMYQSFLSDHLSVTTLLKICTEKVNCISQESSNEHEPSASVILASQHWLLVLSLPAELLYEIRLISN